MSDDVKAKRAPARTPEQKAQDAVDAAIETPEGSVTLS